MANKKTYRPKADAEGLVLTFPNARTGQTIEIGNKENPWPFATEDADEQRFLNAHPLVTDRSVNKKGE